MLQCKTCFSPGLSPPFVGSTGDTRPKTIGRADVLFSDSPSSQMLSPHESRWTRATGDKQEARGCWARGGSTLNRGCSELLLLSVSGRARAEKLLIQSIDRQIPPLVSFFSLPDGFRYGVLDSAWWSRPSSLRFRCKRPCAGGLFRHRHPTMPCHALPMHPLHSPVLFGLWSIDSPDRPHRLCFWCHCPCGWGSGFFQTSRPTSAHCVCLLHVRCFARQKCSGPDQVSYVGDPEAILRLPEI